MSGFLDLVEQEADRLYAYVRSRVSSDEDSWDIMQEVFLALWARWNLGDALEDAAAWLFRVSRNKISDHYRRRRVRAETSVERILEESDMEDIFELVGSSVVGPRLEAERKELRRAIGRALEELPSEQREVFVQTELRGMRFRELAEATGEPINTLLSRKRYAVLKLREILGGHDD
jgi:RNA polymerase sigma factor (sigma-70 family)